MQTPAKSGRLLRVREQQPWALMAARSAKAREMAEVLEEAITILGTISSTTKSLTQRLATTEALLQYLATREGRPDILTLIEDSND